MKEIKKLKAEIEELKANSPNDLEKQAKLQAKLEKMEKIKANFNEISDNKFPTSWVVGGGILTIIGAIGFFIIKKKKRL